MTSPTLLAEIIDSLDPPEGFAIDIQPPLPTLTTKRVFLSQVLTNLISNAIKHHDSVTGHLQISALVVAEQGTIRLESSLGQGKTFYVTWPKSHG